MRRAVLALALASLAACLAAPVVYFQGNLPETAMKTTFSIATAAWFISASVWSALRR